MATQLDKTKGQAAPDVMGLNRRFVEKVRVNTLLTNIASGDSWKVWPIPAKCIIECVDMVSVAPEGAADTVSVGDVALATQYLTTQLVNGAAGVAIMGAVTTRKYYNLIGEYLTVLANAALTAAIFDLLIHYEMVDIDAPSVIS